MLRQLLTITRNTFTESIRQPIFVVLVFVAAMGLVLNVSLAAYSMEPGSGDNKVLIDLGLSTVLLTGLLLAAFSATGVLSEEIESKTVLTVVSKPVARPVFVLGKYLGVAGAISVAYWTLAAVFILTLRHRVLQNAGDKFDMPVILFGLGGALAALLFATAGNYLYRRAFTSTFVLALAVVETFAVVMVLFIAKDWTVQPPLHEFVIHHGQLREIAIGLGLIFEAVLVLTAVAIAVSTRLGQLMTLIICLGVFFVGLVSNSFSGWVNHRLSLPTDVGVFESITAIFTADISFGLKLAYAAAKALYLVLPNLQFFWPADAISQGNSMVYDQAGNFTLVPVAAVSAYGLLYTTVIVAIAIALFQRREVG